MLARCLEGNKVEGEDSRNVEQMWEQVKQAMVNRAREVRDSVRVGGKNPKNVWWNDVVKAVLGKKEET